MKTVVLDIKKYKSYKKRVLKKIAVGMYAGILADKGEIAAKPAKCFLNEL